MPVCMYAGVRYMHVCECACICAYVCTPKCVWLCLCIYMYVLHMNPHVCVCMEFSMLLFKKIFISLYI